MHPEDPDQNFSFPKFIFGLWTAKMRFALPTVYFGALLTLGRDILVTKFKKIQI